MRLVATTTHVAFTSPRSYGEKSERAAFRVRGIFLSGSAPHPDPLPAGGKREKKHHET